VYSRSRNSATVIEIDGNKGPHNRLSENLVMAVMGSLVPSLSPHVMMKSSIGGGGGGGRERRLFDATRNI